MNAEQRKVLAEIIDKISEYRDLLENCQSDIEDVKSEEEDKYDNLPDSLRDGEKGERFQEVIDLLDNAISELESADTSIYDCLDYLNEASE